jgi:hypothetical protein
MGRTITPQSPVHTEENILREILGFRAVSREPVANVKDASAMATHKFLPGRPFALEALLDQLGILLQRIFSLFDLLRCMASCESASLSKSRLAVHLGLPTMERKVLPKCSPWVQPGLPTVMGGILLSKSPRDKRINEVAGVSAGSTVKVARQVPRNAINSARPRLRLLSQHAAVHFDQDLLSTFKQMTYNRS